MTTITKSIQTPWPAAYRPMGTPDINDLDLIRKLAKTIEDIAEADEKYDREFNPQSSQKEQKQMSAALEKAIMAAANLPETNGIKIDIKSNSAGSTTKITLYKNGWHLGSIRMMTDQIEQGIARAATLVRQCIAITQVGEIKRARGGPISTDELKLWNSLMMRYTPSHPALILADRKIVGQQFVNVASPTPAPERAYHYSWVGPGAVSSGQPARLSLNLQIPLIMTQSYIEQNSTGHTPLRNIIALEDDVLAKLPQCAQDAWQDLVVTNMSMGDNSTNSGRAELQRFTLEFKPIRQIIWETEWEPRPLAHDHVPTNALEQAFVNLAISGEII